MPYEQLDEELRKGLEYVGVKAETIDLAKTMWDKFSALLNVEPAYADASIPTWDKLSWQDQIHFMLEGQPVIMTLYELIEHVHEDSEEGGHIEENLRTFARAQQDFEKLAQASTN
jgi:hypothetical protein